MVSSKMSTFSPDDSNDTNLCSGRPASAVTTLRNGTIVVFRGRCQETDIGCLKVIRHDNCVWMWIVNSPPSRHRAVMWEKNMSEPKYLDPECRWISLCIDVHVPQDTTSGSWIETGCRVQPAASQMCGASRPPLTRPSPAATARAKRTSSR